MGPSSVNLGNVTPQPPDRTPHRSALLPGREALLAPGASPELPCLPKPALCYPARLPHDVPRGRQ
jgi:hypothetical protein